MRHLLLALAVSGLAIPTARASTCIDTYRVDHTETPDDQTVLFVMKDKSIYRSQVSNGTCPGLRNNTYGFTYETDPGTSRLCGNLWTLRQNFNRAVCLMGDFVQVRPPAKG